MSDNPNVAAALCELRSMVLDADAMGMRGRSRSLRAAIAALEAQASAPGGEVDGDVIHAAVAYFNGLNTKASLHMAAEIEKCYAALIRRLAAVAPGGVVQGKPLADKWRDFMWNEKAARSASENVLRKLVHAPCDSVATSDCARCSSIYLARRTLALLAEPAAPAQENGR